VYCRWQDPTASAPVERLRHLWRIAAGSADEVVASLRVAEAFGHLEPAATASALALGDRVLAMLWRLTH